jgi:hypothetical protein
VPAVAAGTAAALGPPGVDELGELGDPCGGLLRVEARAAPGSPGCRPAGCAQPAGPAPGAEPRRLGQHDERQVAGALPHGGGADHGAASACTAARHPGRCRRCPARPPRAAARPPAPTGRVVDSPAMSPSATTRPAVGQPQAQLQQVVVVAAALPERRERSERREQHLRRVRRGRPAGRLVRQHRCLERLLRDPRAPATGAAPGAAARPVRRSLSTLPTTSTGDRSVKSRKAVLPVIRHIAIPEQQRGRAPPASAPAGRSRSAGGAGTTTCARGCSGRSRGRPVEGPPAVSGRLQRSGRSRRLGQDQRRGAEPEDGAVRQRVPIRTDRRAVQQRAVGGAEVRDSGTGVRHGEQAVLAADVRVLQPHAAAGARARRPPCREPAGGRRRRRDLRRPAGPPGREPAGRPGGTVHHEQRARSSGGTPSSAVGASRTPAGRQLAGAVRGSTRASRAAETSARQAPVRAPDEDVGARAGGGHEQPQSQLHACCRPLGRRRARCTSRAPRCRRRPQVAVHRVPRRGSRSVARRRCQVRALLSDPP